jgi:hypothetical protein
VCLLSRSPSFSRSSNMAATRVRRSTR